MNAQGAQRATDGNRPRMGRRRAQASVLLALVLSVTFLLHLLVIAEPFGRDQGIFAYIGQTILHGGVPYRDAWDHKTPGIYVAYALAFAAFGQGMPSVHLLDGISLTITALFLYLIGRRLHGEAAGLLGAFLYGVSATLLFEWWDRGQAEIYMTCTSTIAVYFLLRALASSQGSQPSLAEDAPAHSRRSLTETDLALALCGIFCGATIYFKPSALPLLAGLALMVIVHYWRAGARRMARPVFVLGMGFALSFVPMLVYFAANGALNDLIQTVLVFNTYHARIGGNPTLAGIVGGTLDFGASMNILAPLAVVGLWAIGASASASAGQRSSLTAAPARLVIPIWLISAAAGIWTQGKFFSYHWSPVLPALALLAAWGLLAIGRELRQAQARSRRMLAALVCLAVVAVYAAALLHDHAPKWQRDASYLLGRTTSEQYLANFSHNIQGRDIYSFAQTQQTALYLQAHSAPDDYVLVWGFQALVNYLADRRSPTRYIFTYPLTFDRPETAFRVQARRTFLHDLEARPPLYIVLVTNDINPLQAVDSFGLLAGFPEFQRLIQQDYRIETDIGEFHLYRRIDA